MSIWNEPRPNSSGTATSADRGGVVGALVVDGALVSVFCLIGRRSHDEGMVLAGLARTLWPFLTGLGLGWAGVLAGRWAPRAPMPAGLTVWASTLAGGMLLRVLSGQGVAFSFVLVAGCVLAVFLIGWRVAAALLKRRAGRAR